MAADPCYEAYLDSLFDEMAGGLFVDVGAHLGFITVRAARRLKGRGQVLAIEPHPDRFRCLLDNVTGNQLEGVRCLNYALGARNGHAALYEPDPSFGPHPLDVSLVPTAQPGRELKVPLRTLDDILTDEDIQNVSLIKLDVEGYEAEVLRGAQRTLQHGPRIVFEAHTPHEVAAVVDLLPGPVRLRQLDSANYLAETASATAEH